MEKKAKKWLLWIVCLTIFLIATSFLALALGSIHIPIKRIIAYLFDSLVGQEVTGIESVILFKIRFPRIILGFMVGGALATAGVIFQGMFRNPLVEPFTLGVSGGAALGVSLSIIMGFKGGFFIPLAGFLGALITISLVYLIASRRSYFRISTLLLTGVMISFVCSSFIMLIMVISKAEELHGILFWIMGSLQESNPNLIGFISIIISLGVILSFFHSWQLNALALGEEEALHLGVNIEKTKRILFVLASLLTGVAVSVSGIIGFVGLVVPHFMRLFVGSDHRILLPTSFLLGGSFLVLADTLARVIVAPIELPVGVITGVVGGIIFVYFLSRRSLELGG